MKTKINPATAIIVVVVVLVIIVAIGLKVVGGKKGADDAPVPTGTDSEYPDMQKSMQESGTDDAPMSMDSQ